MFLNPDFETPITAIAPTLSWTNDVEILSLSEAVSNSVAKIKVLLYFLAVKVEAYSTHQLFCE